MILNAEHKKAEREKIETIGFKCPLCGGSLDVEEGLKSIKCRYCGSSLYISAQEGPANYYARCRINEGKAKHAAISYLLRESSHNVGGMNTSIIECKLVHVPFWRMHGRLIGWIAGETLEKEMQEIEASGPRGSAVKRYKIGSKRKPFSKLVFKHIEWSAPAAYVPHLQMQGVSLKATMLRWEVLDHSLKTRQNFALPTMSEEKAESDAYKYLTKVVAPTGTIVRSGRFKLFDNDISVYYYPIYFISYKHRNRIFTITVDGVEGRVMGGAVPYKPRQNVKNIVLIPAAAALMTILFPPLPLIALGILYVVDTLTMSKRPAPIDWLTARCAAWFGEG
ncbi:MAG: hypothetical protein B6D63_05250 [Candidatus Latescibacteria bacterium 4484_7]|nr:MAG: hypothetical protein B6D63_05250 [Candidatus Latescibacteria bacterium 4484_7]